MNKLITKPKKLEKNLKVATERVIDIFENFLMSLDMDWTDQREGKLYNVTIINNGLNYLLRDKITKKAYVELNGKKVYIRDLVLGIKSCFNDIVYYYLMDNNRELIKKIGALISVLKNDPKKLCIDNQKRDYIVEKIDRALYSAIK